MTNWSVEKFTNTNGASAIDLIDELQESIREQDYADLVCTGGDACFGIIQSLAVTEEGYIYRDDQGRLLCIVGLCREFSDAVGRCIWMLGTKHIMQGTYIKSLLIRESRQVVARWVSQHGLLYNCVNRDNEKSIRWLTWLGGRFLYKQAEGKQIISFYIDGRGD